MIRVHDLSFSFALIKSYTQAAAFGKGVVILLPHLCIKADWDKVSSALVYTIYFGSLEATIVLSFFFKWWLGLLSLIPFLLPFIVCIIY